ncbi:hypothetical protein T03_5649 [Trichinella britovi]|uniref:Uncharacterized protein n=1 Tax=Trichinella britovi TaxID=45882 RepID=A0A0V1C3M8_TRIBR|nr:hypothetical protein T03_5649 [Trichinella britovi]
MAENLHLVLNERGNYNLVHEGRVYNLKHTNMQDKQWVSVKKGCRGSIYTNFDVDAVLDCNPYADDCTPDNDILYKMEKKNALKRRAAEELKTILQNYHEEASSASADLETADFRQLSSSWRFHPTGECRSLIAAFYCGSVGVVLQPQTVICDFETALIPALQGTFPRLFPFLPSSSAEGVGMRTSYIHEAETKKKVKMLLATAFLPPHDVPVASDMPPDRLPLWNVYNVNICTNNDLEGWHFKMNRLAGKRHLGFYELLQLLIDEHVSTETLIQQVTSGRVTASDLQIKNKKYEEVQLRITALTAEYDGDTHTMEQS